MNTTIMKISPEVATKMLAASRGNRTISRKKVAEYAHDMAAGNWQTTHQGIAFDTEGALKDGHHRLNAIVESGATVEMCVTYGVPVDASVFDRGYARNLRQHLLFDEGVPNSLANNSIISVARLHIAFQQIGTTRCITDHMVKDFLYQHQTALLLVNDILSSGAFRKSSCRNAGMGHALFCAIEAGEDIGKVRRFAEVAGTGFSDGPEEYAAIVARNQMSGATSGMSVRTKMSNIGQAAIKDFIEGKQRRNGYRPTNGYYFDQMTKKEVRA